MKNLRIILFLSLLPALSLKAQTVQWAKKGISQGFENGNAIVTDDSGNVYVTGQYEFTSVFSGITLHAIGQHDIMTIKYTSDGNIKWIKPSGGPGGDIGNGIGIDALHNVYVTGEFEDSAKFGNIKIKSTGGNDGFLVKYDANGNVAWVRDFGCPTSSDKGRALAVSPSGNVYITGNFSVTGNFSGITLDANGGNDIFIVKYNTNGNVVWAKKAGGSRQDRGYGIVLDANENVYLTGTFTQSATFRNTTITNTGNLSSFIAKYDSSGLFQWAKAAGSCCDTTKANAIAIDENNNLYVSGYFMDTTKFESYTLISRGNSDAFLVKYDPDGHVIWARQGGGIDEDGAYGVKVDTLNHLVYITGLVRENGSFDNQNFNVYGYKDVFIAAYDMDGDAVWVKTYGGNYRDVGLAIAVDPAGYIYTTGLFNDVAYFGPVALSGYPNQPWADFFVTKVSPPLATVPATLSANLLVSSAYCSDLMLTFDQGTGDKRIIIAREGAAVNTTPTDGVTYNADEVFGNGSDLGNGNFVVYNGTGNNVTITNLIAGASYHFAIFEYNGFGMASNFTTSGANASGSSVLFPITITSTATTICAGDVPELVATGMSSYAWLQGPGLQYSNDSTVIVTPQITTTYTVTGITMGGCQAESNITIEVLPIPIVNVTPVNAVCLNGTPFTLNGGMPAGGTYIGNGVSAGIFNPMSVGSGMHPIEYLFTDVNGCSNIATTYIQVHSLPGVILSSMPSLCDNQQAITLSNGSPAGGVYSGTGVNNGVFDPVIGSGAYQVNYSYTNHNGCTGIASAFLVVKSSPVVNLGTDITTCASSTVTLNAGSGFATYQWSTGEVGSSIVADSAGTGLGTQNISVTVTNTHGCSSTDFINVTYDLCAGIDYKHSDEMPAMVIYPNPFKSEFTFISEDIVTVNIFDVSGRLLEHRKEVAGQFTTGSKLSPGIYFVEVKTKSKNKRFQVIKTEKN